MVFSEKIMDFPYFSGSIITVFLKTMIHFSEFCTFFGVPKKKSDVVDSKDICWLFSWALVEGGLGWCSRSVVWLWKRRGSECGNS